MLGDVVAALVVGVYPPVAAEVFKRSEEQGLDSSESTRMLIMEDRDVLFVFTDEAQSKMVWSWLQ